MFLEELNYYQNNYKNYKEPWWIVYCLHNINNRYHIPSKIYMIYNVHIEWSTWYNPFQMNYNVILLDQYTTWKTQLQRSIHQEYVFSITLLPLELLINISHYL